MQEAIYPKF